MARDAVFCEEHRDMPGRYRVFAQGNYHVIAFRDLLLEAGLDKVSQLENLSFEEADRWVDLVKKRARLVERDRQQFHLRLEKSHRGRKRSRRKKRNYPS